MNFKQFPKEDEIFQSNNILKIIEQTEKYFEIWWELQDIKFSLDAFLDLFPDKDMEISLKKIFKDIKVPDEIAQLANSYLNNRNEFQKKRDNFEEFINEFGKVGALMFLSPKLFISLEVLFGGLIVNYSKMFVSNKNHIQLNIRDIIKENNELINFHDYIIELRHKHYAHNERQYSKFCLKYKMKNDKIIFNRIKKEHIKQEFYQNFNFKKFYQLVINIENYINKKINNTLESLQSKLTKEQINYLKQNLEFN